MELRGDLSTRINVVLGEICVPHVVNIYGAAPRLRTLLVDAEIDADPVEPCGERCVPLKIWQLSVRLNERVLHRVGRVVPIAQHSESDRKQPPLVLLDQLTERTGVASLGRVDELFVFGARFCPRFITLFVLRARTLSGLHRTGGRRRFFSGGVAVGHQSGQYASMWPSGRSEALRVKDEVSSKLNARIARAKRTLGLVSALDVIVGAAAFLGLGTGLALLFISALPFSFGLRATAWGIIATSAALGIAWRVRAGLFRTADPRAVAARIEEAAARAGTALGDRVRSAVALVGSDNALAERHVEETVTLIDKARPFGKLRGVALVELVPTIVLLLCATAGFVVAELSAPDALRAAFARLLDDEVAERLTEARARSALPLVTDLQIELTFPAHTGLGSEKLLGTSGDIRAPRGTQVEIKGRADRDIKGAVLVAFDKEHALKVEGRNLSGRFVTSGEGSYHFRLVELDGDEETDPVLHKITIVADELPSLELSLPGLETEPGAEGPVVNLDDEVGFTYRARDDFGVAEVRLVIKRAGKDASREVLARLDLSPRQFAGSGKIDISSVGARPGDRLSVWVEAEDNDTISGPKVGRSSTAVLVVFSPREQHRKLIELQERLLDQMVHALGDQLESPVDERGPTDIKGALTTQMKNVERMDDTLELLDEVIKVLAEDELSKKSTRRAIANMRQELGPPHREMKNILINAQKTTEEGRSVSSWSWRRVNRSQRTLVRRLETHALYLEDLLNQQRLAEVKSLADEMKRTQEELKKLIEQYKASPDDKTREALLDEIARLREQLSDLMKRMASLQRDVPDEYLNDEAMRTDEMMSEAQDLESLIEQGKLDEAAAQLQKMAEQTQKMLDGMQEAQDEYGGDEYKELREKMQKFGEELGAIEAEQKELLERTEGMLESARRKAEKKLGGQLKEKLKALEKKAERAKKLIEEAPTESMFSNESEDTEMAKARAEALEAALEMQDIEDALEAAADAASAARGAERSLSQRTGMFGSRDKSLKDAAKKMKKARPLLEDIQDELVELLPEPEKLLSETQRQMMQKDAERQRQLAKRARELQKQMDDINGELPIFSPEHGQQMEDAAEQMQRGSSALKGRQPRRGRGHQQNALNGLKQISEALQQSGSGQGGVPMPLPGGSQSQGDQEGDGRDPRDEKVKIPGADEYQVPDAFRKDILDAMREGAPDDWEAEVKRYYEGLVK